MKKKCFEIAYAETRYAERPPEYREAMERAIVEQTDTHICFDADSEGWAAAVDITRQPKESQGLGDTVEKFTKATGIKKVVDKVSEVTGIPCGCNKRKAALNKLVPYKNT